MGTGLVFIFSLPAVPNLDQELPVNCKPYRPTDRLPSRSSQAPEKLEVGNLRFLVLPPSHNPNSVSGGLTYPTTEVPLTPLEGTTARCDGVLPFTFSQSVRGSITPEN